MIKAEKKSSSQYRVHSSGAISRSSKVLIANKTIVSEMEKTQRVFRDSVSKSKGQSQTSKNR